MLQLCSLHNIIAIIYPLGTVVVVW